MYRGCVALLLMFQATLLAWQAYRYSPTVDEPAHLVSGLSHWKYGHFDLYRVNPPLVRLIASLPVLVAGAENDWGSFTEDPYSRPEFSIGTSFADTNGFDTFWYVTVARLACIPICLVGGYFCYRWAREMYGNVAGITALTLWCFCPNVLGNGALITPDAGSAAFGVAGGYYFWRWLRDCNWSPAILAGIATGLSELSKSTWIVLFGLWPLLWMIWRLAPNSQRQLRSRLLQTPAAEPMPSCEISQQPSIWQLIAIMILALYMLNLGYCFENSFQRLSDFRFISETLGGADSHKTPGNRFDGTWLGAIPVPLPANYVKGIDVQRYDFERGKWSYLRGELKHKGGWWYYYLYAMCVKIPAGTLLLFGLLVMLRICHVARWRDSDYDQDAHEAGLTYSYVWLDEVVMLAPAIVVITVVSSQTGFTRPLRYVLPSFPFLFVWVSQMGQIAWTLMVRRRGRTICGIGIGLLSAAALISSIASSLAVFPHSLSYFNEFVGGPLKGSAHLLDANSDWDQDLLYVKEWYDAHPEARPFYLTRCGFISPIVAGIDCQPVPGNNSGQLPGASSSIPNSVPSGWFAISVNELLGERSHRYAWLRRLKMVDTCGYSIRIYHGLLEPEGLQPLQSQDDSSQIHGTDVDRSRTILQVPGAP